MKKTIIWIAVIIVIIFVISWLGKLSQGKLNQLEQERNSQSK